MQNEGNFHPEEISQRDTGIVVRNVLKACQRAGKGKYCWQILRREAWIIRKDIFDAVAASESPQYL